jgi:polysaccharide lyase family 4-like protein
MNIKNKYSLFFITLVSCSFFSCYKYQTDIKYGTLTGSLYDKFTNTKIDDNEAIVHLSPANVANGSIMNIDSTGNFTNTRIIPGVYTVSGYVQGGCAFTSDSTSVTIPAGGAASPVSLSVEPWISILTSVTGVTDSSVTIQYILQGNNGLLPAGHGIAYSTIPPAVTYGNWVPTDATNTNGTYSYTITGLVPATTYFITAGAYAVTPMNPNQKYNYGRQVVITTTAH